MKFCLFIIIFILFSCCKAQEKKNSVKVERKEDIKKMIPVSSDTKQHNRKVIKAYIDTISISQVKDFLDKELPSIYEYYKRQEIEDYDGWSEKMFGRCCSEADLSYSELLNFKINSNTNSIKYPFDNLFDKQYTKAYVFKKGQNVEINLYLDKNNHFHRAMTNEKKMDDIIKKNDTIMYPIKLSLINGYVKSKELFYKNGRIKKLEVLVNNESKGIVQLIDTPLIQEFSVNTLFKRDDVITLKPLAYYKGTKYDDICISELQSNLGYTTHLSFKKKYIFDKIRR